MAIIYSYPAITDPKLTDLLLVTDVSSSDPKNQTKTITLQQVADLVDDEVTLQEVLNASDPGVTPPTAVATGNITLTGNIATTNLTTTSNVTVGNNATVANNLTVDGDLTMNLATSDIIMSDGNIQAKAATDLNFVVTTGGKAYDFDPSTSDVDFNVGIGTKRIRNANWELDGSFDLNAIGNVVFDSATQTIRSGGQAVFASTGGDTIIGADDTLYLGQTTGTYEPVNTVIHASQNITISTDTAATNFKLNGTLQQIESNSDHYFDNEIRLSGSSPGTVGQVIKSEGAGAQTTWADPTTLLALPSTQIYAGDASNVPAATNFITVDVPNNDVTLGTNATQTLVSGGARYNTNAGTGTGLGSGNANIQFGREAMAQVYGAGVHTGSGLNLAIGNEALMGNVGVGAACSGNTAVGWQAMKNQDMANTDLVNNVALGSAALRGGAVVGSNCGGDNVAIGRAAIQATTNVSARRNVGVGAAALTALTTAEGNTAVGYLAGTIQATGNSNTLIGAQADGTTNACEEGVAVGKSAKVDTQSIAIGGNAAANVVNSVAIGHDSITQGIGSVALGKGAVNTAPNTITINVSNVNGPAAFGGLQPAPAGAGTIPPLLTPGDVYYIPPGIGGNVTSHNLLAVVP